MNHRDRAIACDRRDRPVEAIQEYESALASREELQLADYLNLAMHYANLFDYGYRIHHGLDRDDIPDAYGKAMRVLELAEEHHGPHTGIDFLRLYTPWDTLFVEVPDGAMEALAARGDSKLPSFFLFSTSRGERYRADAEELLEQVAAGGTTLEVARI